MKHSQQHVLYSVSLNFQKLSHRRRSTSCKCNLYEMKDRERKISSRCTHDIFNSISVETSQVRLGRINKISFPSSWNFSHRSKMFIFSFLFIYLNVYYLNDILRGRALCISGIGLTWYFFSSVFYLVSFVVHTFFITSLVRDLYFMV